VSRVVLLVEAREDVLEAFRWYEKERRGLGKVFRASLNQTIQRIRRAPLASPVVYRGLRRALVDRFPYGVFYRVQFGTIMVVGVIHGHRDPSAWQRRA
jgi:toxin ParE1/3/4